MPQTFPTTTAIHRLGDRAQVFAPLDTICVTGPAGGVAVATDGAGHEYARTTFGADGLAEIVIAGALGTHTIRGDGQASGEVHLPVEARSKIADAGGRFSHLFAALDKTMRCYHPSGVETLAWRGREYHCYVHWILDHVHTAKGMQFVVSGTDADGRTIDPTASFADLWAENQKPSGMVWSNCFAESGDYFHSAYSPAGFSKLDGGLNFNRQPVENHNEYNYLETLYLAWKGNGDDAWMRGKLDSAIAALEYSVTDPLRWSARFGLLKRGYTIDSWDFQVHDKYTVEFTLGTAQQISAETKFGVFFGDNHGYALACEMLAEMLSAAGRPADAATYLRRAAEIHAKLNALTWNGRFFTHHIEEDPAVVRDLGVDEKSQIAMSNCYALNRGISREQAVAIVSTYQHLRVSGGEESPGEWYAIYPPFGKGFGTDSDKWQYMNAGVHGHAAGELARGCFEHGFERYGADILLRLGELATRHEKGWLAFAWTGGWDPAPPPQVFTALSLAAVANMDTASDGESESRWLGAVRGNDLAALPSGDVTLAAVPWKLANPATNARRVVAAVCAKGNLPRSLVVPIGQAAGAVYLLHTAGSIGPSGIGGSVNIVYADGSETSHYLLAGKHIAGWWYPALKGPDAGVAWTGNNSQTSGVGLTWCCLPADPGKTIRELRLTPSSEGAAYVLAAVTLADRPPHHRAPLISHGGPDNWSAGTTMYALMQGLAGVKDLATKFRDVRLSPRWTVTGTSEVQVVCRYGVSNGYVAYGYRQDTRRIGLEITGSGESATVRVLLPTGRTAAAVLVRGEDAPFTLETVGDSAYAITRVGLRSGAVTVKVLLS